MVLVIVLVSLPASQSVEVIEEEVEEEYRYEDVIEEECDEEWKSYHGHCMKFRNVA